MQKICRYRELHVHMLCLSHWPCTCWPRNVAVVRGRSVKKYQTPGIQTTENKHLAISRALQSCTAKTCSGPAHKSTYCNKSHNQACETRIKPYCTNTFKKHIQGSALAQPTHKSGHLLGSRLHIDYHKFISIDQATRVETWSESLRRTGLALVEQLCTVAGK